MGKNSPTAELHSERIPRSLMERSGNPASGAAACQRQVKVSERIKKLIDRFAPRKPPFRVGLEELYKKSFKSFPGGPAL